MPCQADHQAPVVAEVRGPEVLRVRESGRDVCLEGLVGLLGEVGAISIVGEVVAAAAAGTKKTISAGEVVHILLRAVLMGKGTNIPKTYRGAFGRQSKVLISWYSRHS